ncbi:MAG: Hsp20/alpha crystallin family protein [Chloroflexota bacterium]
MITRWNPMRDMLNMQSQIDRMFDDAWKPLYDSNSMLPLDVDETGEGYIISAAVPGVKPDDININVQDNILTISGETGTQSDKTDEDGKRVLVRERRYGSFSRSVRMAMPIDADSIVASYENGVLTLDVPKRADAQPRRIPVTTGETLATNNG